jgi:hypothetical protein
MIGRHTSRCDSIQCETSVMLSFYNILLFLHFVSVVFLPCIPNTAATVWLSSKMSWRRNLTDILYGMSASGLTVSIMKLYYMSRLLVRNQDSSVGTATGYALVRFPALRRFFFVFLFSTAFRPVLGPTQSPIQRVPGAASPGVKRRGVKLTTCLHSPISLHGIELN